MRLWSWGLARCCCRPTGLTQGAVIGRLRLFAWCELCLKKILGNVWGSLAFSHKSNKCLIQNSIAIFFPIAIHFTPIHPTKTKFLWIQKRQLSLIIPLDRQMFLVHPCAVPLSLHTHTHRPVLWTCPSAGLLANESIFLGFSVLFLHYKCTEMLGRKSQIDLSAQLQRRTSSSWRCVIIICWEVITVQPNI